jgi:P-type E1-E2 ATPase
LQPEGFTLVEWKNIYVGDLVMIKDNEYFAADILLLGSSDPKKICFIETKNLDGETNLKIKYKLNLIY